MLSLQGYQSAFEKIKLFDSIDAVNDTVKDTMELRQNIDNAREKIEAFNEREQTFS